MDSSTNMFHWHFKLSTPKIEFVLSLKSALPSEFAKQVNRFTWSFKPGIGIPSSASPPALWFYPFISFELIRHVHFLPLLFVFATMVSGLYHVNSLLTVPLFCSLSGLSLFYLPCHCQRVLLYNTNLIMSTPSLNLHWLMSAYTNHP